MTILEIGAQRTGLIRFIKNNSRHHPRTVMASNPSQYFYTIKYLFARKIESYLVDGPRQRTFPTTSGLDNYHCCKQGKVNEGVLVRQFKAHFFMPLDLLTDA